MGEIIVKINQIICFSSMGIAFLVMLSIVRNKQIQRRFRLFYLYPLIPLVLLLMFYFVTIDLVPSEVYKSSNRYSLIFHHIFLSLFIIKEIPDGILCRISKYISVFFLSCLIVSVIFVNKLLYIELVFSYFGLFLVSTLYFLEKFINIPVEKLSNIPSFWIVLGVFVNMVFTLPIAILFRFVKNNFPEMLNVLLAVSTISAAVMYLFFIKGIICAKKQIA